MRLLRFQLQSSKRQSPDHNDILLRMLSLLKQSEYSVLDSFKYNYFTLLQPVQRPEMLHLRCQLWSMYKQLLLKPKYDVLLLPLPTDRVRR